MAKYSTPRIRPVRGGVRMRDLQKKAAYLYYYSGGGGAQLFVSNSGSGTGDGSSAANSMSLANFLNATLEAGTTVRLNKGETYDVGEIDIDVANVKFDAYGTGDNPILRGSEDISGLTWTDEGGGVYSTPMAEEPNWVWINGECAKLAETSRIEIQSRSDTTHITVTHGDVSGFTSIVGASLVAKQQRFRNSQEVEVTAYNGAGVITIDGPIPTSGNIDLVLYNKFEFLSGDNEWAWEAGELRVKAAASPATLDIRASAYDYCFKTTSNTRFRNLEFQEYYQFGIWSLGGTVDAQSCYFHDIRDSGVLIQRGGLTGVNVSSNTFERIGNAAIWSRPLTSPKFNSNVIDGIGMQDNYAWQTWSDGDGSLVVNGIQLSAGVGIGYGSIDLEDDTITGTGGELNDNTVSNVAFNGISISSSSDNTVLRNTIYNFMNRFDDGGGLYFYHYNGNGGVQTGTEVAYNICYDGKGGNDGWLTAGIYLDSFTSEFNTHNNVCYDNFSHGLFHHTFTSLHVVHDNIFHNNKVSQIEIRAQNVENVGNDYQGNIYSSVNTTQRCLKVLTGSGGAEYNPFSGGESDNNYYINPFTTAIANTNKGSNRTFAQVKTDYSCDANSVGLTNYLDQPAFWTQRMRLIVNHTNSAASGSLQGWEDHEGNSLDNYSIPARSAILALVGDSENSVQFVSVSEQAVNFGTHAGVQIERDDVFTIAFKIKVAANPASGQSIFTNFGAANKGFTVSILTTGQLQFELRNTPATNRYNAGTNNDYADNAWHDVVIKKPAVWTNTTFTIDGSVVAIEENDNLSGTIVSPEDLFLGVRETVSSYFDGLIDELTIWLGTTDPESKYPDHYWRLGEDGYIDSGVSETKLNGTPINNPTISSDVI